MSEQPVGGPPVTRPTMAERLDLSGRTAIVTGGSRGLGRAIALGLAEAGADVVVASRKLDACRAAADEIAEATGRKTPALACHVGRWADCDRLIDEATSHFGRLDVLVNNAGMSPLYPDLASVGEELYDKTLAVNPKGPFRLAALASTRMAQSGGGSIPMRRIGEPGEVVDLVVCLASPASGYTTGALIRVDGGAAGAV